MKVLKCKQIWTLVYWETFRPKKINKFYEMLQIGQHAMAAFKEAKRC